MTNHVSLFYHTTHNIQTLIYLD